MRATRSCVAGALVLGVVSIVGCSAVDEDASIEGADGEPDLDAVYQNIDPLVGSCVYASGVVTVTSTSTQLIIVSKRAVDSMILINGELCTTSAVPPVAADSTKMKRLVIKGSGNDETLLLDYSGGLFAPGIANAANGGTSVELGGGNDEVSIVMTSSADSVFLGADGLAFNADRYKDVTFTGVEALRVALGSGADALTATNAVPTKGVTGASAIPLTVFGGAGNDVIVGGAAVDTIWGGPGNDILSGGASNDTMYGEEGADIMFGGPTADGDDTLDCGNESPTNTSLDFVSYEKRTRVISATLGSPGTAGESGESDSVAANCEGVIGGPNNDALTGDANANQLYGGPGDDTLIGAGGDDVLNGGAGNDVFDEENSSSGADTIVGGLGIDLVDYSARTTDLTVTMDGAASDDGAASEGDNIKADIENIVCGSGNDNITGNTLANRITGGDGNDTLNGGPGSDTFLEDLASNGADTINGGLGVDLVDYGSRSTDLTVTMGDELANDGASNERDNIGSDVENLKAGSGNDTLTGNALANSIQGGTGNDTLRGEAGDDTLDGSDRSGVTNNLFCGDGADLALNPGLGAVASDCELKGL